MIIIQIDNQIKFTISAHDHPLHKKLCSIGWLKLCEKKKVHNYLKKENKDESFKVVDRVKIITTYHVVGKSKELSLKHISQLIKFNSIVI